MKFLKFQLIFLMAGLLVFTTGCDDDDDASPVTVSEIVATGTDLQTGQPITVDLNGATAATDVPLDAVISITFAREVDVTTINSTSVSLSQGGTPVSASVSATGSTAMLSPDNELERGLNYTLSLSSAIKADDGGSFSAITRTFTAAGRAGITPPNDANQLGYWDLNGDANADVGSNNGTEIGVTYDVDRFGEQESAAYFDGDVSLIEIPNGDMMINSSFTLSYWMRVDTAGHIGGHFVAGVGDVYGFFIEVFGGLGGMKMTMRLQKDDATTTANDFFFNGDGMDASNGGWVGIQYERDLSGTGGLGTLLDNEWAHVVFTFDGAANTRSLFINGQLMETDNLNNAPALANVTGMTYDDSGAGTDVIGTKLALGFNHDTETTHWNDTPWGDYNKPDANHFKGWLDDVRVFDVAYTEEDAMNLYNAESP